MIRQFRFHLYAVVAALLLEALCGAHPARAQSSVQTSVQSADRSWQLAIALGQGQRSNPLVGGDDIDINYVIDFSWYGERFFFDNGDLGYTLWSTHNVSISTLVTFNNERNYYNYLDGQQFGLDSIINNGFGMISGGSIASGLPGTDTKPEADDHTSAEAMDRNLQSELADRDAALNGGFELLFISPYGDIQAQMLSDLSNTHDGEEAWLSWSYPWYTRTTEVALTVGLEWKSRQLVGYYYGVQPDEAFVGRPAYKGDSGTNGFVRLAGRYQLGEHWMWASMVEREFLSSAITRSPIVADDAVTTFFTGFFYNF